MLIYASIFAVLLAGAIGEIVYTSRTFPLSLVLPVVLSTALMVARLTVLGNLRASARDVVLVLIALLVSVYLATQGRPSRLLPANQLRLQGDQAKRHDDLQRRSVAIWICLILGTALIAAVAALTCTPGAICEQGFFASS